MNIEHPTSNIESSINEKHFRLGMIAAVVGAIAVMIACTRWGLATSSDSARYVRTARNVYGFTSPEADSGEPKHEQAHFPPFYPMCLATAAKLSNSDPVQSARWLHVLIFAANVLLAGVIVRRCTGSAPAAVLAAFVVALAPESIYYHAWLLSEALFILLSQATILLLCLHLTRPRYALLIGAAAAGSLAMMTRYAGAAILPTGILALLLLGRRTRWNQRIADAALFCAAFLILPMLNFMRNLRAGGSATNRALAWHPISLDHIKDGIASLATWVTPLGVQGPRDLANAHPLIALAGLLFFTAVLLAGGLIAWRRRRSQDSPAAATLAGVATLYILCFLVLLVFSISLVDFYTPADTRVLSPVFVVWVLLLACIVASMRSASAQRVAVAVAAVILAGTFAFPSATLIRRLWRDGDGFARKFWQESPTLAAVKGLPADQQIFTNAPGVVYLITGRQTVLTVPSEINASSRLPNPDYAGLMEKIRSDIRRGRGVLVYCRRYGQKRPFYPTEGELVRKLDLHVRAGFGDGAIYDCVASTTTMQNSDAVRGDAVKR